METRRSPVVHDRQRDVGPRGPFSALVGWGLGFIGFLLSGWLLAILIEWVGLVWWWRDEGITRAQVMLVNEQVFLDEHFERSWLGVRPTALARVGTDALYDAVSEWGGWLDGIGRLQHVPDGAGYSATWNSFMQWLEPLIFSAAIVTQIYVLRVMVLVLSLPTFLLFGAVGMAEGLMRRDLRRWGGGRESSFAHGAARMAVKPLVIAPWLIYLSLPFSVHPNAVMLPAGIGFGIALCVVSSTFKKYL